MRERLWGRDLHGSKAEPGSILLRAGGPCADNARYPARIGEHWTVPNIALQANAAGTRKKLTRQGNGGCCRRRGDGYWRQEANAITEMLIGCRRRLWNPDLSKRKQRDDDAPNG